MAFKKLAFAKVVEVLQHRRVSPGRYFGERLRSIPPAEFSGTDAPVGCFAVASNGVYLPKRKRGQKFLVRYAVVHEKEL